MGQEVEQEALRAVRDYVSALRWGSELRGRALSEGTAVERRMKMLAEATQMETQYEEAMVERLQQLLATPQEGSTRQGMLADIVRTLSGISRLTWKGRNALSRLKRALSQLRGSLGLF